MYGSKVFSIGLLGLTCAACGADVDDGLPSPSSEEHTVENALNSRIRYNATCTPFNAAYLERSMFYARTVGQTPAFQQCVENAMRSRYKNCGDPLMTASIDGQVARVRKILKEQNNTLHFYCDQNNFGDANASYQGFRSYDEHTINILTQYDESFGDWSRYGRLSETDAGYEPWQWRSATMLHEFSHTHDYRHEGGCNGDGHGGGQTWGDASRMDCADPSCGWTSVCGGTGRPPAGMTQATAGEAQQEFCSFRYTGRDDQYYGSGEPSLPYILSGCADALVVQSYKICGSATQGCGQDPSKLNLLASWRGDSSDPQSGPGIPASSCACAQDPRHVIALRTGTGHLLTAQNGGGGTLQTRWSAGKGSWQTLYAIDQNGGALEHGDPVHLKAFDGHFVDLNFRADAAVPRPIEIGLPGASGPIVDGSLVTLKSWLFGTFYPRDDGAQIVSTSNVGQAERLRVVSPRRDVMIYLKTPHNRYVDANPSSPWVYNRATDANIASGTPTQKANSAFWVIDHNGGQWMDGDAISLEGYAGDRYHFVSAPDDGHVRMVNAQYRDERFVIHRVSSGTPRTAIAHGDVITFRSRRGTYLTAMPPSYFSSQLRNYGTYEGDWQKFTVRFVSQHDRPRRTW